MTPRQADILSAIIQQYAQTAEPVGSLALADQFDCSPATIRAEMGSLEDLGYIAQPHISAGRVPTDKGYRMYVNSLQDGQADNRTSRVIAKRVKSAGEVDNAVRTAADSLAELTHNLGLATLSSGLYMRGIASLFAQPEFYGHRQSHEVARLLDHLDEWLREASPHDRVSVWIGHENPVGKSSGCSLIVARFASPYSDNSYIGVVGPTRQNYGQVIGLVDYAGKLLEESFV